MNSTLCSLSIESTPWFQECTQFSYAIVIDICLVLLCVIRHFDERINVEYKQI